jgi:Flp pilus assembly protein TadD
MVQKGASPINPHPNLKLGTTTGGRSLAWRAEVSKQRQRVADVIVDLKHAVRLQPDYHWACLVLGEALLSAGDHLEAANALERAVTLKPTDWWAWSMKGAVCLAMDDFNGALATLDRSLSLNPDFPYANQLNLNVLMAMGLS